MMNAPIPDIFAKNYLTIMHMLMITNTRYIVANTIPFEKNKTNKNEKNKFSDRCCPRVDGIYSL